MFKKKKTEVNEVTNTSGVPTGITVMFENDVHLLHLNHNLGRQDLDEAFQKVEDKINEIIKKL